MNDLDTQQLIFRAGRWPWKWFSLFRNAAEIAKRELCKFNVLKEEHHLLKLEFAELHKNRLTDAERIQQLRDEFQALKIEAEDLRKDSFELKQLRDERPKMVEAIKESNGHVTFLYEYIRRNKVTDDRGRDIPEMRRFPNIFRQ